MASSIFPNDASLNYVRKIVCNAAEALQKPCVKYGAYVPEIAGAAVGGVAGGAAGIGMVSASGAVAGLSGAGITSGLAALGGVLGGGMVAGIAVAAAPVGVLAVGAYATVSWWNSKRLKQTKDALLKEAMEKQNAIIEQLGHRANLATESVSELEKINVLLQEVIRDLEKDLGMVRPAEAA